MQTNNIPIGLVTTKPIIIIQNIHNVSVLKLKKKKIPSRFIEYIITFDKKNRFWIYSKVNRNNGIATI